MKRSLALAAAAALVAAAHASDLPPAVVIEWSNPDKFRDVRVSSYSREASLETMRPEFERALRGLVETRLPEGSTLTLRFTEVDLAGEFEPWRGPDFQDIRIVRSPYYPALAFEFSAKTPDGAVLRAGEASLRDLAFQSRVRMPQEDNLFYEKEMLRDWFRSEFPRGE